MTTAKSELPVEEQDLVKLAVFQLASQDYALDIMKIREIVNPVPVTRVPKAPPFVEGMIELRGTLLPVVDLRKRFDAPAAPLTRSSKYISVAIADQIVGLLVDAVSEVVRIPRAGIRPPPGLLSGAGAHGLLGVYRHKDRLLLILDPERLLDLDERQRLAVLQDDLGGSG